jgi:hypothetical protein
MNAQPASGKPRARQVRNIQRRTQNSAKDCLRSVTDALVLVVNAISATLCIVVLGDLRVKVGAPR